MKLTDYEQNKLDALPSVWDVQPIRKETLPRNFAIEEFIKTRVIPKPKNDHELCGDNWKQ